MRHNSRTSSRNLPFLAILFLLMTALFFTSCGEKAEQKKAPAQPPPPQVKVTQVIQKDVPIYIELVGQTKGSQDVAIRA